MSTCNKSSSSLPPWKVRNTQVWERKKKKEVARQPSSRKLRHRYPTLWEKKKKRKEEKKKKMKKKKEKEKKKITAIQPPIPP